MKIEYYKDRNRKSVTIIAINLILETKYPDRKYYGIRIKNGIAKIFLYFVVNQYKRIPSGEMALSLIKNAMIQFDGSESISMVYEDKYKRELDIDDNQVLESLREKIKDYVPWSYEKTNINVFKDLLNGTTHELIPPELNTTTTYQDSFDEDYIEEDEDCIEEKEECKENFPTILLLELPFIPINHIMSVPP